MAQDWQDKFPDGGRRQIVGTVAWLTLIPRKIETRFRNCNRTGFHVDYLSIVCFFFLEARYFDTSFLRRKSFSFNGMERLNLKHQEED